MSEAGGGAQFTSVVTAQIKGVSRLFAAPMVRALRGKMQSELAALKRQLEQRAAAQPEPQRELA